MELVACSCRLRQDPSFPFRGLCPSRFLIYSHSRFSLRDAGKGQQFSSLRYSSSSSHFLLVGSWAGTSWDDLVGYCRASQPLSFKGRTAAAGGPPEPRRLPALDSAPVLHGRRADATLQCALHVLRLLGNVGRGRGA